jgi:hypothetical protein
MELPADHDARLTQAEKAAGWWLGDPEWAGMLIGAYLNPQANAERLADEQGGRL